MSSSTTVAVAGATGTLGAPVTNALLAAGYKVKVLTRGTAANDVLAAYQTKGAHIVFDAYTGKNLQNALQGVDILLSTVGTGADFYNGQVELIDAAKAAGFGLDGIKYAKQNDLHPFLTDKAKLRDYIEKSGLEYTYIFNGLFAEFLPRFGFDLKNKTATLHATATARFSITSLADIARFVALALSSPHSRNASLRVVSHTATFQEYVQLFEQATGSKWQIVEDLDARERIAKSADPASQLFPDFIAYAHSRAVYDTNENAAIGFQPTPVDEIISAVAKSQ
ncbi:hypothetical protein BGZ70_005066 [Mortierella alpina]|uniref:NmrA-like domain-containing protein n=1 Tax=Mortierella alpina TaxID=64518 RepID=A0A9P6JCP0_MORAP|nr:hypothetical protein BGZ70_005066 [Mortierella alpina]